MSDHITGSKADIAEQKKRSARPESLPLLDAQMALPSAADMERCVLSCFMQAPAFAAEAVGGRLKEEHFTVGPHGILWRVMQDRFNLGQPVDPPALIRALVESKELDHIGGSAALSEIYIAAPNPAQAAYYGGKVHESYVQRRRVLLGMKFTAAMMDPGAATGGDEIVAEFEAELLALSGDKFYSAREQRTSGEVLEDVVESLLHRYTHRGQILGLQWGFPEVDRRCNGFQEEDFIIVAARPAMGKTAFATSICERVAMDTLNGRDGVNVPVLFFSLEMSDKQIVERSLMGRSHMALGSARTGMFSHAQGSVLYAARESLRATRGLPCLERAGALVKTAIDGYSGWLARNSKRMEAVQRKIAKEFEGKYDRWQREVETEMGELASALATIDSGIITWKDGYGMTTAAIRAEIRKWVRRIKWQRGTGAPPPLVCIDYLQLVKGVRKSSKDDPRQNIVEVCDTFKGLAKELGIVVMGLAQIKRNDKNPGAEPQLHEIKESGAFEEYADYVFTLHRPCYYKPWRALQQPDRNRWDKLALGRDRAEVDEARGGNDDDDNGPPISDDEWTQAALAFRASGLSADDWTGQTYYEADVLLGIKKARHGPTDDVRILFRGPEVRFVPVQEKLFSNNPDEREHGGD